MDDSDASDAAGERARAAGRGAMRMPETPIVGTSPASSGDAARGGGGGGAAWGPAAPASGAEGGGELGGSTAARTRAMRRCGLRGAIAGTRGM